MEPKAPSALHTVARDVTDETPSADVWHALTEGTWPRDRTRTITICDAKGMPKLYELSLSPAHKGDGPDFERWHLKSETGESYDVAILTKPGMAAPEWSCTCPHYQNRMLRQAPTEECKHIRAILQERWTLQDGTGPA